MSGAYDSSSREKPARRRLLKVLASGSGAAVGMKTLPAHWTQPVLDTVALPAHAQTSPEGLSLSDPCGIEMQEIEGDLVFSVSGAVVGGGDLAGIQVDIEAFLTNGGEPIEDDPDEESVFTDADGSYGPIEITSTGNTCPQVADSIQVTVTSPDPRLAGQTAICTQGFDKGCSPDE